uniref:Uncharacterized protein n=1 Tax=Rhizophora mucronata TaxID=61149 RepID=A0A2P2K8Q0_RHIMU
MTKRNMAVSKDTVMAIESYRNRFEILVKTYLFADSFIPYTSFLAGIFACKVVIIICMYLSILSFLCFFARISSSFLSGLI